MLSIDLSGRTALVVGGEGGIGAAIVARLRDAGARAGFSFFVPPGAERPRDPEGEYLNILEPESLNAFLAWFGARFGSADLLVYTAGDTRARAFADIGREEWERNVGVNLSGAAFAAQAVLPGMAERRFGRVVFIGSAVSVSGGGGIASYAAAKAGLVGLTRSLSKEFAPRGVTVNTVSPALIDTKLLRVRYTQQDIEEKLLPRIPVGRIGVPDDIAYMTVFLCSAMASYVTGQHILVDGGSTLK